MQFPLTLWYEGNMARRPEGPDEYFLRLGLGIILAVVVFLVITRILMPQFAQDLTKAVSPHPKPTADQARR